MSLCYNNIVDLFGCVNMSKYKNKKIPNRDYYNNVLLALGLSRFYIYYNNYYFFGNIEIDDQAIANKKIDIIIKRYEEYVNYLLSKYNKKVLITEIGAIYDKLQSIHLANDQFLEDNKELSEDKISDISYPAKAADLMARKSKLLLERIVINDNKKNRLFVSNRDYKKFVILLYYYSLFIFYRTRSNLSKKYENGVTSYFINPSSLEPINTYNENQNNSKNENDVQFNYNSKINDIKNPKFESAFFNEKGISFEDYKKLMDVVIEYCNVHKRTNLLLKKEDFIKFVVNNFTIDEEKFKNTCVFSENNVNVSDDELYKNNSNIRLDTAPIIDIGDEFYILNKGIIWNSKNFWDNVHLIGMIPYCLDDDITKEAQKIIKRVSKKFEDAIYDELKKFNKNFDIKRNKKTKDIFQLKELDDNEWDMIAIDHKEKIVIDIEIKFVSTSLTESQLAKDMYKIGYDQKNYFKKFEKRIDIENRYMDKFLNFCKANKKYKIIHLMVMSKVTEFDSNSNKRDFSIIHFGGFEKKLREIYKDN